MAQFSVPSAPARHAVQIDTFLGVDLTNAVSNIDPRRSPDAPNMIRTAAGKVGKRYGFEAILSGFEGRINGAHLIRKIDGNGTGNDTRIVHAGTGYFNDEVPFPMMVWSGAADALSMSVQLGDSLYIFDGKHAVKFDGRHCTGIENDAYTPTILIGRKPTGGGYVFEPINMITPRRKESYYIEPGKTARDFYLSTAPIDAAPVTARVLQADGTYRYFFEGSGLTVTRATGLVRFTADVSGITAFNEDICEIEYSKTIEGYADRINKCNICTIYGVGGAHDRIFATGNPAFPNYDWYCDQSNPMYWPDVNYSVLGGMESAIVGYSVIGSMLAAHKRSSNDGANVYLREGEQVWTSADKVFDLFGFPIRGTIRANGANSPHTFCTLGNEPVYFSEDSAIVALTTATDGTGERYGQERSYYLSGALSAVAMREHAKDAYAAVYDQMYFLAMGGNIYILDATQAVVDRDRPYSARQYAAFIFPGVDARVIWTERNPLSPDNLILFVGDSSGVIRIYRSPGTGASSGGDRYTYTDDGEPYPAYWTTAELSGNDFSNKKTFVYIAARIAAATATGVRISAREAGIWTVIMDYNNEARYFDFSKLDFSKLSFSTDTTPRTLGAKIKIKNVDKVQFRFENSVAGEPFELYYARAEYTETGNKYRK